MDFKLVIAIVVFVLVACGVVLMRRKKAKGVATCEACGAPIVKADAVKPASKVASVVKRVETISKAVDVASKSAEIAKGVEAKVEGFVKKDEGKKPEDKKADEVKDK